eukprot:552625-Rhodomonas_salina.2
MFSSKQKEQQDVRPDLHEAERHDVESHVREAVTEAVAVALQCAAGDDSPSFISYGKPRRGQSGPSTTSSFTVLSKSHSTSVATLSQTKSPNIISEVPTSERDSGSDRYTSPM